jgi:hypothetical protein
MGRLRRFEGYRFIGRRDEMVVYDCDDPDEFAEIEQAVSDRRLDQDNLISTFAPDVLPEAVNRGFRPRSQKLEVAEGEIP